MLAPAGHELGSYSHAWGLSSNRRVLAFRVDYDGPVVATLLSGGGIAPVYRPPPNETIDRLVFSPDGARLALLTSSPARVKVVTLPNGQLIDVTPATTNTSLSSGLIKVAWSLDGRYLAILGNFQSDYRNTLHIADTVSFSGVIDAVSSSDIGQDGTVAPLMGWLADNSLVFAAELSGDVLPRGYRVNADGSNRRDFLQGTDAGFNMYGLGISPNGATLAWATGYAGGVFVAPADGSAAPVRLGPLSVTNSLGTAGYHDPIPWSPSGQQLLVTGDYVSKGNEPYVATKQANSMRRLAALDGGSVEDMCWLSETQLIGNVRQSVTATPIPYLLSTVSPGLTPLNLPYGSTVSEYRCVP